MTPERLHKVEELYYAALERKANQRAVFLQEACGGDKDLREEVESLLAQEGQAGSFLEASPLPDIAAQAGRGTMPVRREESESPDAAQEASPEQSPFDFAQDKLVGRQLGSYLVREKIGEGGMGDVYRAFDTKLRRDVALKVLPKLFARNPERMARFRREAQLLASLNHKNIAAIHGFEELPEANFLVLELVEGETFAERIKRQGLLPIKDALTLCAQVAEGLEAAHRKGITHRDIKPANIKVTPEGDVKVLDFGLAKALAGDRAQGNLSELPTMEPGPTKDGQILGTPAYMSPEQVRGQEVDKRTDIWAFGCVLYALLTGKQAFRRDTLTDTVAAVLEHEADWEALPPATPANVRTLLRRCLRKDANLRLHDVADARIEITEALAAPATVGITAVNLPARPTLNMWRWALVSGLASAVVTALVAGIAVWNLRAPEPQPVAKLTVTLPPDVTLPSASLLELPAVAISPDGSHLAYVGRRSGTPLLFLRALDSLEARPIEGTDNAAMPFFSPDGQWLGFLGSGVLSSGVLKKISIAGGAPVTVANLSGGGGAGASWRADNTIVFGTFVGGLWQVSASGGTPQPLTRLDVATGDFSSHRWPQVLPGGNAVLFTVQVGFNFDAAQIEVQNLETGERKVLVQGGTYARYLPTGHLAYVRSGTLMAAAFDLNRLELAGPAVPVIEGVMRSTLYGGAQVSISDQGSLVYIPGSARGSEYTLVWVDRRGMEQPIAAPPRPYIFPRLSPDGRQLAVESQNDIWVYDIPRSTLSRLTFEGVNSWPLWSPDGKRVAFNSARQGKPPNLFWKPADGSGPEERLTTSERSQFAHSFSPDGQLIAFVESSPSGDLDIWTLPTSANRKPQLFFRTPFIERGPKFSPDSRWLAYASDETGRLEIYVQPFPGPGGKTPISADGGTEPIWAPNGELFYWNGNRLMSVETKTQPSFSASTPRLLFEEPYERAGGGNANYAVTDDGQRFVMVKAPSQEAAAPTQINVVLNWFEELKRRVPVGR